MSDTLTTITKIINSPPGQLAAGGVLAGIVWKFFERVEALLTDNTKLEIAVWLLDRKKLSSTFRNWPDTFAKIFDRVFGPKHLSWRCFSRSGLASILAVLVCFVGNAARHLSIEKQLFEVYPLSVSVVFRCFVLANLLPDYFSLLHTRFFLAAIKDQGSPLRPLLLALNAGITLVIALVATKIGIAAVDMTTVPDESGGSFAAYLATQREHMARIYVLSNFKRLWFWPAFFPSIWVWLYAGSGFLLKAARRFDIGFEWFNRKFDIEKKPLQSIGLIAGALVAVVYLVAVIVSKVR